MHHIEYDNGGSSGLSSRSKGIIGGVVGGVGGAIVIALILFFIYRKRKSHKELDMESYRPQSDYSDSLSLPEPMSENLMSQKPHHPY